MPRLAAGITWLDCAGALMARMRRKTLVVWAECPDFLSVSASPGPPSISFCVAFRAYRAQKGPKPIGSCRPARTRPVPLGHLLLLSR